MYWFYPAKAGLLSQECAVGATWTVISSLSSGTRAWFQQTRGCNTKPLTMSSFLGIVQKKSEKHGDRRILQHSMSTAWRMTLLAGWPTCTWPTLTLQKWGLQMLLQ